MLPKTEPRGRGRGRRAHHRNIGPPEPYRSQSIASMPHEFRQETKDTITNNRLPSSINEISVEMKPSLNERSTSRRSLNRATSTIAFRDASYSTESNTIKPMKMKQRPDNGGTAGNICFVYTNHFLCHIPRDLTCHQYDIELEVVNRDGVWRQARKDDRFLVLRKIIENEKFPFVWYDEGKSLYSTELFVDLKDKYEVTIKDIKSQRIQTYRLLINKHVKSYDMKTLWDYFEMPLIKKPRDSIRILETLLKQTTRATMICCKNQFYNKNQTLDDLGDGRGLANGFYQAMFVTKIGPTLNINSTFTCFYQPMNLVEFLSDCLQCDITRNGINENQKRFLQKILKPLWLETQHTGTIRKYRVLGYGKSAKLHTFPRVVNGKTDADSDERQSVYEYFSEKYNINIKYPDLPTIELYVPPNKGMTHYLPLECCTVQPWQRSIKPLTTDQCAKVTRKTVVNPQQRHNTIMQIINQRNFNNDTYLNQIGMTIEDQKMIKVAARVIAPPEITYTSVRDGCSDVVERVRIGKWNLKNRFRATRVINIWACVLISSRQPTKCQISVAEQFVTQFPYTIQQYGIDFTTLPLIYNDQAVPETIHNRLKELKDQNCEVVIFILNGVGDDIYKLIKYYGNQKLGIITQCTDFVAIAKNIRSGKLDMYLQNLVQKFNAKLGGVNGTVSLVRALTSSMKHDDVFMFFGSDVTHTTCSRDKPSIAAVVGSVDPTSTQYASRVSEQYPARGKVSIEIIKDLYQMSTDLLRLFAQRNQCFPNRIVFYRDGVDDGHFQKILDTEVQALKNACKALYMNNPLPKITFIIVKKRHNTRFFVKDLNSGAITNIQAGTIVDTDIVYPYGFDFYLNSHCALQGTSRPILYHVLYDDIGFTSDEIQSLTYYLCHTDVRCTKAVSIPAPVHYAHLAAYQSRDTELSINNDRERADRGDFDDETDEDEFLDEINQERSSEVKSRLINLDPSIQDTMWYV